MPGYFRGMHPRAGRIFLIPVIFLGLVVGCGDESGTVSNLPVAEFQTGEIDLSGNIANAPETQSILVFAFLRSGENASDEPVSVGIVDEQGQFVVSGLPPGQIGVTFLADGANDGVIDRGDPIANLADPDQQLNGLHSGDRVNLADVQLDFAKKRAVADAIEVVHSGDSPVAQSTPTPEG